jgi:hypothetical protein
MRAVFYIAAILFAFACARSSDARIKTANTPIRRSASGISRPKGTTKYYRKENRPKKSATRGPKHKNNNYDQHGWY